MSNSFDEAATLLNHSPVFQANAALERAYCAWKVKGATAGLTMLQASNGEGEAHLKALLLMRTGGAKEAHRLYAELAKSAPADKQASIELVCLSLRNACTYTKSDESACQMAC